MRVVITGAGSGLGKALAMSYAKAGAQVVVTDVVRERALQTVRELPGQAHQAHAFDVGSESGWNALRVELEQAGVDVLINNAGIASGGPMVAVPPEEWERVLRINLTSVYLGVRAIVPLMLKAGRGQVINIASFAGFAGAPTLGAYGVSKAGVIALSESLLADNFHTGLRVSVVCPSFFKTNLLESLQVSKDTVGKFAERQMQREELNAEQVADYIRRQAERGEFMIMPQKDARRFHLVKRLFPNWARKLVRSRFKK
jgi:NAD(P)-dependent dehydrogenase (short-subunit alcohol dehydrogenase family)